MVITPFQVIHTSSVSKFDDATEKKKNKEKCIFPKFEGEHQLLILTHTMRKLAEIDIFFFLNET